METPTREEILTELVGTNPVPRFKITQPGDPIKQREMKATLANRATTVKIQERFGEIENPYAIGINVKEMRRFMLDVEMSLCGGG